MPRIYLDNAATSWPKPESVYAAIDRYQREVGASFGRGSHAAAERAAAVVDAARRGVAALIGEGDSSRIAFANSGTDALTTAIFGTLVKGGHAVASVVEHNAVLRPLRALADRPSPARVETTLVGSDAGGVVDADAVIAALRDETRLVVMTHASNVTGALQPVEAVAERLRDHPALLLVDAAQTLGKAPVDVRSLGADILAAPGHKGLLGPLGTGVLWVRPGVETAIAPLRYGGVGSDSRAAEMPAAMPERFEAGSLNMPGLAGLAAAAEHLAKVGVHAQQRLVTAASERVRAGLAAIPGVGVLGNAAQASAGVVAFNVPGYDPHDVATLLASLVGVECRAGLHCAPRLHEALGTAPRGAVRFSPGATTEPGEIDAVLDAIAQLAAAPPS